MAASYVGTFGGSAEASFDDNISWTTTRTIEAGEHVVVIVAVANAAVSVSSITVGSLSLSLDYATSTDGDIEFWSARATAQISSGATVTVTMSGDSTYKGAVGEVLAGVETTAYLRASASNENGFGSTIATGTTDSSPLTDDIALAAAYVYGDSSTTVTSCATGFTMGGDNGGTDWGVGSCGAYQAAYKVLTGDGAVAGTFTLSGSIDVSAGIVVYKAAAGGGAVAQVTIPAAAVRAAA